MKIVFIFALLPLGMAQALAACNASDTRALPKSAVKPSLGSCERVVSSAPSITETLFALGLGDRVVGVTDYCRYPKEATHKPRIGGYLSPSIEAVVAQRPTLVLLLPEHADIETALNRLEIPTLRLHNDSVDEILSTIQTIGSVCHAEAASKDLLSSIQKRITTVESETKSMPVVRTLITMGRSMGSGDVSDVYIAGQKSFYNDLIRMAGGINVYTGEIPIPAVSKEGLVALNPEVIVDMIPKTEGVETISQESASQEWKDLPIEAVKYGRVFVFEELHSVVPGPRFVDLLEHLASTIHLRGDQMP